MVGSASQSVVAMTVPWGLNDSCAASAPTSWTPELVKMLTWFWSLVTTRMSINSES